MQPTSQPTTLGFLDSLVQYGTILLTAAIQDYERDRSFSRRILATSMAPGYFACARRSRLRSACIRSSRPHRIAYHTEPGYAQYSRKVCAGSTTQAHSEKPTLLQLADWDRERRYDEDPPMFLHYSIEWKVNVCGRMRWKDSEQDPVLAPAASWQLFLQPKVGELLCKKLP